MKPPFVNVEEKDTTPAAVPVSASNEAGFIAQGMASGRIRIPRGVYRFKTLEEADEWMDRMVARSQQRPPDPRHDEAP